MIDALTAARAAVALNKVNEHFNSKGKNSDEYPVLKTRKKKPDTWGIYRLRLVNVSKEG